jgi:hypothetical protein
LTAYKYAIRQTTKFVLLSNVVLFKLSDMPMNSHLAIY